ncbi:MAG TPA: hypothetical protein VN451_00310, partial [Chitinophagaceae bacterium]|nr:hypothetical protein [Chitinophagaceae bacterium]
MRICFIILFFHFSLSVIGQRIDFRNDSLFISNFFVNGYTNKSTLDSLLGDKGKEKELAGKHKQGAKEAVINWKKITYKDLGLIFTKNDYDPKSLGIGVKLHKNSNPGVDWNNMPTKTFKGELYIDNNFMNDKRTIDQLKKMENCTVSYQESSFAGHTGIISCTIICLDKNIRAL